MRQAITTNPNSPLNLQRPSFTNNFDWRPKYFPTSINPTSALYDSHGDIVSPFWQSPNFQLDHLVESKDNRPEDGWELLVKDFGGVYGSEYPEDANRFVQNYPYVVLYNKYIGKMRVFMVRERTENINFLKFALSFSSENASSLLDLYRGELVALDAPFIRGELQSIVPAQNETGKWFFAEFPMIYDPCTCNSDSKLKIVIENIVVSNLQLEGRVSGQLVTNNTSWASQEKGNNFSFTDGIDAGKKYVKFFSTLGKFVTETKGAIQMTNTDPNPQRLAASTEALNSLGRLVSGDIGLLKFGIHSVPYVNLALSALDMFTGGGNSSPQKVSIMPMTLTADLKIKGTLSNATNYSQVLMYNPGSVTGNTPSQYSKYNEVLGVFNLLETPELAMTEQVFTESSGDRETESRTFKLAKPIKYVLNPASGLEVQDVQLAFTMRNTDITNENNFTNIVSTTDFVDGFQQSPVGFYRTNSFKYQVPEGQIAVKIILNLRRKDGQGENVLSSFTYPAKFTNAQTTCTGCFAPASLPEVKGFCKSTVYQEGRLKLQKNNGKPIAQNNINFSVAPNPANDVAQLKYEVGSSKHVKAYITDITGRIVSELFEEQKETGNYSVTVPTLSLHTGMYMFVLEADGERYFQKVFINHSF